jgi:glyoxylase-like metal-dependent hydrolase (beta-lactamase superfamily II)
MPDKPHYKINVLSVADVYMPYSFLLYHDFTPEFVPVPTYMWLITGNGIPVTLVDTGVKEDTKTLTKYYPEMKGVTPPPTKEKTIAYQLGKFGFKPEDIQVLLHTHLHVDHAGNDCMFPNAKMIISRKELMFSVAGIDPGYPAEYISYIIEQLPEPGKLRLYDDDFELFPGIRLMITEGHTQGSTIISVPTSKGLAYICGDIIYNQLWQTRKHPHSKPDVEAQYNGVAEKFGDQISGNNWNIWEAKKAMAKIMREADIVLPSHDPYVMETYGDTIE